MKNQKIHTEFWCKSSNSQDFSRSTLWWANLQKQNTEIVQNICWSLFFQIPRWDYEYLGIWWFCLKTSLSFFVPSTLVKFSNFAKVSFLFKLPAIIGSEMTLGSDQYLVFRLWDTRTVVLPMGLSWMIFFVFKWRLCFPFLNADLDLEKRIYWTVQANETRFLYEFRWDFAFS